MLVMCFILVFRCGIVGDILKMLIKSYFKVFQDLIIRLRAPISSEIVEFSGSWWL